MVKDGLQPVRFDLFFGQQTEIGVFVKKTVNYVMILFSTGRTGGIEQAASNLEISRTILQNLQLNYGKLAALFGLFSPA